MCEEQRTDLRKFQATVSFFGSGRSVGRLSWELQTMIRKLSSGYYRLYSRKVDPKTGKRRNLGTFSTRGQAEQHEREIQYFKRH